MLGGPSFFWEPASVAAIGDVVVRDAVSSAIASKLFLTFSSALPQRSRAFFTFILQFFGLLLAVGLGDLAHEFGPRHVHCLIHRDGFGLRIVLEDFHHQGCIVRQNDTSLLHA
jgi:hypothetical protein